MADYSELLAAENDKKPQNKPVSPVKASPEKNENAPSSKEAHRNETTHHVMTSSHHDVDHRAWRDIIENTETLNSALRLTQEERYAVEDMIQDLERKHKIKTSMNEITRLGLLSVIHDYKKNKQQSLVYKVKKS